MGTALLHAARLTSGVDLVFSNHYTRVHPEDNLADVIGYYVETNNLGTTAQLCAAVARWRPLAGGGEP